MYEIVAGIDTNERRARALANAIVEMPLDRERVRVTLLHDFTDNPEGASVTQVGAVRRATEILDGAGIEVALEESSGDASTAIIEAAEELDADLVAVTGRKHTPAGKVLFGSVTQGVILGTERPVLVCSAPPE
ncbi:MAG: universal stress protein [Haloferacaceae archaeon]